MPLARAQAIPQRGGRLRGPCSPRHPVDLVDAHGSRDREAFTWLGLAAAPAGAAGVHPAILAADNTAGELARGAGGEPSRGAERAGGRGASRAGVSRGRSSRVIHNGVLLDRIDRPVTAADRAAWRERIGPPGPGAPSRSWRGPRIRGSCSRRWPRSRPRCGWSCRPRWTGADRRLPAIPDRHRVVRLPFLADVRPLYDLVELVLHPSRWDALPQAVLEAMALGKPVIASRATGNG